MGIYHYTSAQGVLGLLQHGEFWATEINFMNDYRELHEGIAVLNLLKDRFKTALNKIEISSHNEQEFNETFEIIIEMTVDMVKASTTNIVSFSTDEDYLRQWMSYCPSNNGYCIEFDKEKLANYCSSKNLQLSKVEYNIGTVLSGKEYLDLNNIILEVVAEVYRWQFPDKEIKSESVKLRFNKAENLTSLIKRLQFIVARIKPSKFVDENEYRIIDFSPNVPQQYRERNGVIIPYKEIPFPIEAITKITIGPSSNQELAKKGLEILRGTLKEKYLKKDELLDFKIVLSECSLRQF
ncbi:DUF2971 domain-containing protein [Psychromonas sp. Urea-02u-13]|uniref:DUF2971 domain-containing protein n=1 Tax=Psychromonas sp. Urea-02u-13 TaxID=2058326 RepID=UPI000C3437E5|nr:DUF2971 domain-containing protein [Psychromonas sp. Urea-02u-13]PKG37715.1 hypothetical protein CXF74_17425 [Psychromonas sp. Urea-02u-13]